MDHVIEMITMVCEMCCIVVEVFMLGCHVVLQVTPVAPVIFKGLLMTIIFL